MYSALFPVATSLVLNVSINSWIGTDEAEERSISDLAVSPARIRETSFSYFANILAAAVLFAVFVEIFFGLPFSSVKCAIHISDRQRTLSVPESFPVFVFPLTVYETTPFFMVAFSGIGIV